MAKSETGGIRHADLVNRGSMASPLSGRVHVRRRQLSVVTHLRAAAMPLAFDAESCGGQGDLGAHAPFGSLPG